MESYNIDHTITSISTSLLRQNIKEYIIELMKKFVINYEKNNIF
jgi:hypothetical protein